MGQNDQSKTDWANLKKYAAENKILKSPSHGEQRIVFMYYNECKELFYFYNADAYLMIFCHAMNKCTVVLT